MITVMPNLIFDFILNSLSISVEKLYSFKIQLKLQKSFFYIFIMQITMQLRIKSF